MAYMQKSTPPPNRILSFSLKNFVGGLNNRSEELEVNEASNLMNMRFSNDTVMENRYGQKYADTFQADGEIVFIDEFKPYADLNVLIRATASKLYIEETVLTTIAGKPYGVNHQGKYFFTDGVKFYVYGKFAQVTSTYEVITGTPNPDYILMEIGSPELDATRLDTTHVRGVLDVDYTAFKVYYTPCENEFVDTFSGANVVPTGINYIVSHNGRLFVSGDDKDDDNVFISDMQNPFYFPVSLPMQLPPNSDQIVGMAVYDNAVVVGRTEDIYVISGITNRTDMGADVFSLRKINSHTGFANQDAVKVAHNYLFFLGDDGIAYSLSSVKNDQKVLSTTDISKTIDITKEPLNLSLNDIYTATSCFHNDEWYLSIKDKVLVYSYLLQKWTVYNNINPTSFYVLNHELIWGRNDGRTCMFDEVMFLDFGIPYQAYWYSRQFDMEDANAFKQFREFFLVAHTFDDYLSDINILFEVDYVDVKSRVIISNKMSLWGKSVWGDRFITRNIVESLPFVIGRRARNIRFKLSCNYNMSGDVLVANDLETFLGKKDGTLVYVTSEDNFYLYMSKVWKIMTLEDLNQRMRVYQINGDYEFRGKR